MPLMRSLTTSPRAAPARNRARNVRTSRTARRLPAHGPASTAAWPHLTAGSSAWEASPRQAPTPGQANGLRRVSAPAPRHAARGRGSAILRATTRGAGGGSGPLASNLERWGSTPSWWHGAVYAALSGDIRPDIDVARGLWRAVAVQIPGARGAARRGRFERVDRLRRNTAERRAPPARLQKFLRDSRRYQLSRRSWVANF